MKLPIRTPHVPCPSSQPLLFIRKCVQPSTGNWRLETLSERRANREAELESLLRLQVVVQHVATRRIHRENQAERHVQHRHEEANFRSRRCFEREGLANDVRLDWQHISGQWIGDYTNGVEERRIEGARRGPLINRLLPGEVLTHVANLARIEE